MLVSVKKVTGAVRFNITKEAIKSLMRVITTLMNPSRRIVSNENIDTGKIPEHPAYFRLVEKMMSTGLVAPATVETAKLQTAKLLNRIVEGRDVRRKRSIGIVVTSYTKHFPRCVSRICLLNASIPKVAKTEKQINRVGVEFANQGVIIGYRYGTHCFVDTKLGNEDPSSLGFHRGGHGEHRAAAAMAWLSNPISPAASGNDRSSRAPTKLQTVHAVGGRRRVRNGWRSLPLARQIPDAICPGVPFPCTPGYVRVVPAGTQEMQVVCHSPYLDRQGLCKTIDRLPSRSLSPSLAACQS